MLPMEEGILPESLFPDRLSSERYFNEAKTEEGTLPDNWLLSRYKFSSRERFWNVAGMPPVNLFE